MFKRDRAGKRLAHLLAAATLVVAAAGCGGGGGGDGADDGGDGGSMCELAPGRVGLQRLTRAEYNRTVRDLFGVTSNPADAFPPDSSTGGFDNHAQSLTVSPQLASLLLDAAQVVAADAMTNMGAEIVSCDPNVEPLCARDVLGALARRVYRRPATEVEIDALVELVVFAGDEGDSFEQGIEYALQAMLMAPQFLYRSVPPEGPRGEGPFVALDDYAVATRLSYFLWGSTPDDTLLDAAGQGMLTDPDGLRTQFDRMLADPKSAALYDGFFAQWLQLGNLGTSAPDATMFPQFDDTLRQQMLDETRLFFDGILERDGSPLEIINGNQTYANAAIAELYGVSGVTGDALVPIETDPTQRAGILTMPAVLTMTSEPTHPNIVRRGVWLAENVLCFKPPPPPEGIPPAPVADPGETERERLARHRADPSCASCHNLIDPLGFAFENYDALGNWRTEENGTPVDNLGALPDGTEFSGVVELAGLLENTDDYRGCVTTKFMTYALGRSLGADDQCVVEEIGQAAVTPDGTMSDLLWAVVTSDAFQMEEIAGGQ